MAEPIVACRVQTEPVLARTVSTDAAMQMPLSPKCISPEAIDEKLSHYVGIFGSRWALIRCHMQVQFSCAFPTRYLEKRWEMLQQRAQQISPLPALPVRSPLASMDADPLAGIQERLPMNGLPKKEKRWREESPTSPLQPARPPPPSSPQTRTKHLPKGLGQGLCPTFLLSPGSALAAPDSVRHQLKAVYLASRLTANLKENLEKGKGGEIADEIEMADEIEEPTTGSIEVDETDGASVKASPFASEEEKHQIVNLLARSLAGFRRRPPLEVSVEADTPTASGESEKDSSEGATSKAAAPFKTSPLSQSNSRSSPKSPKSPINRDAFSSALFLAHRSGASNNAGGVGSPQKGLAAKRHPRHRWPCKELR